MNKYVLSAIVVFFISIFNILDQILRHTMESYLIVCSIILYYLFFLLLNIISIYISIIVATICIILNTILFYIFNVIHINVPANLLLLFVKQTNFREASMFLFDYKILLLLVLFLGIVIFFVKIPKKKEPFSESNIIIMVLCLIFIIPLYLAITLSPINSLARNTPFPLSIELIDFLTLHDNKERKNFFNQLEYDKNKINIIYMIGESLRGDHLSINGYSKNNTTPFLLKEQKRGNIINFGITYSCDVMTYLSWIKLNTTTPCEKRTSFSDQKTIPYYFIKAGFKPSMLGVLDEYSIMYLVSDMNTENTDRDQKIFLKRTALYNTDQYLQSINNSPYIKNASLYNYDQSLGYLAIKQKGDRTFTLLNNSGSHIPYFYFYEETYPNLPYFKPYIKKPLSQLLTDTDAKGIENVINLYDNTILYTDYQIEQIIRDIEKSNKTVPTVLLYISDHGERLNDNNLGFGHGNLDLIEDRMVPLFFYVNKAFKKQYSEKYKELILNASLYKDQVRADSVFYTLMDIGGFKNKKGDSFIDFSKSLFNKEYKPRMKKDWYKVPYKRN